MVKYYSRKEILNIRLIPFEGLKTKDLFQLSISSSSSRGMAMQRSIA